LCAGRPFALADCVNTGCGRGERDAVAGLQVSHRCAGLNHDARAAMGVLAQGDCAHRDHDIAKTGLCKDLRVIRNGVQRRLLCGSFLVSKN